VRGRDLKGRECENASLQIITIAKALAKFPIVLDGANFLINNPPSPSKHADRILAFIGVV
jgi:hypothetical protein